jgi:hypothetical protein
LGGIPLLGIIEPKANNSSGGKDLSTGDWEKDDNENNKVKTNRKFFMNIIFRIYMIRHF